VSRNPDWYRNYKQQAFTIFTWCGRSIEEIALLHHMALHDMEKGVGTTVSIIEYSGVRNCYTLIIITSKDVLTRSQIEQAIKKIPKNDSYSTWRKP